MQDIIALRIRQFKKLRWIALISLIALNITILLGFWYLLTWDRGDSRKIPTPDILRALVLIQLILLLTIGALALLIWLRFRRLLRVFETLQEEDLDIYQRYLSGLESLYHGVPPYLFTSSGLILPRNFSQPLLPYGQIRQVAIKTWKLANPFRYVVVLTMDEGKTYSLAFTQQHQQQFLVETLRLKGCPVHVTHL